MKVEVTFEPPLVISNWGKKRSKNKFYPFDRVGFMLQEDIICPFCGKRLDYFYCHCKDWGEHFTHLQEWRGDVDHRSRLSYGLMGVRCRYVEPIANLTVNSLSRKKALELGPDFWDDATKYSNSWVNSVFMVSIGTYENGHIQFYCKNWFTKTVYLCEIDKELVPDKTSLVVSNRPEYRGNSSPVRKPGVSQTIATFDTWQDFCTALKES